MKNIHKKIGAIALAGIIAYGGFSVFRLNIHIAEAANVKQSKAEEPNSKLNRKDIPRLKQLIYNVPLPESDFARNVPIMGLLDDDENPIVKQQVSDILDICRNNSRLKVVKLSSEVNKPGMNSSPEEKRGIDAFLNILNELVGKVKGIDKFLEGPQLFFDDVYDFKAYLDENEERLENGLVRIQVENVEGVFIIGNGRAAKK